MRGILLIGVLFAVAYTQSPYGFSNQNQYLLHGVAQSGHSDLADDWLARTKDPTPLFSAYIAAIHTGSFDSAKVWLSYFAVLVLYVVALAKIAERLPHAPTGGAGRLSVVALLMLTHSAIWRVLSVETLGVDYPWYFQSGVASQYILGAGFQPSVFGVLLVASIAAFVHDRRDLAAVLAVLTCTMHFTYVLPATLLALGYAVSTWRVHGRLAAFRNLAIIGIGLGALSAFNLVRFQPSDAATVVEAQRLLAEVRIPHHSLVRRWLDPIACAQYAWIIVAAVVARRSPLGVILGVTTLLSAVLTAVTALTNHPLLCLLFPWRVSAVLVPVATFVIAVRLTKLVEPAVPLVRTIASIASIGVIIASVVPGLVHPFRPFGYPSNDETERELYQSASRLGRRGDVYLIPARIPKLNQGKPGARSTTFTAPPRPSPDSNLIPVDLQRFRILSGRPIFVDFKSIPYLDRDVLEWYRRMQLATEWFDKPKWESAEVREAIRREGITHLVIPATTTIKADSGWTQLWADAYFRIYQLDSSKSDEGVPDPPGP